jgi:hypothetical protein
MIDLKVLTYNFFYNWDINIKVLLDLYAKNQKNAIQQ